MMDQVMLDLETMGTGPSAAIIAVGAVAFDLKTGELGRAFLQVNGAKEILHQALCHAPQS